MTMKLSPNFTLQELMATSHGKLQDMPTGEVILNLTFLCARVLQPLRDAIGRPVYINSGPITCAASLPTFTSTTTNTQKCSLTY